MPLQHMRSFQINVEEFLSCSSSEADFGEVRSVANSDTSFFTARVGSDVFSNTSTLPASVAAALLNKRDGTLLTVDQQYESNGAGNHTTDNIAADLGDAAELERDIQEGLMVHDTLDAKLEHEHPCLEEEEPANKRARPLSLEQLPMVDQRGQSKTPLSKFPSTRCTAEQKQLSDAAPFTVNKPTTPSDLQQQVQQPLKIKLHTVSSPDGGEETIALQLAQVTSDCGMFVFGDAAYGAPADTELPLIPDSCSSSPAPVAAASSLVAADSEAALLQLSPSRPSPRNDQTFTPKDQSDKSGRKSAAANPINKLFGHAKSLFRGAATSEASGGAAAAGAASDNNAADGNTDGATFTSVEALAADMFSAPTVPILPSSGVPVEVNVVHADLSNVVLPPSSANLAGVSASPKAALHALTSPRDTLDSPRTPARDQKSPLAILLPVSDAFAYSGLPDAPEPGGVSPGSVSMGDEREMPALDQLCSIAEQQPEGAITAANGSAHVAYASAAMAAIGAAAAGGSTQAAAMSASLGGTSTLEGESSLPVLEASDSPVMQAKPTIPGGPDDYTEATPGSVAGGASDEAAADATASVSAMPAAAAPPHPSPRSNARRAFSTVANVVRMIVPGFRVSTVASVNSPVPTAKPVVVSQAADSAQDAANALVIKALVSKAMAAAVASAAAESVSADAGSTANGLSMVETVQGGIAAVADAGALAADSAVEGVTAAADVAESNAMFVFNGVRTKTRPSRLSTAAAGGDASAAPTEANTPSTKRKAGQEVVSEVLEGRSTPKAPRLGAEGGVLLDGIAAADTNSAGAGKVVEGTPEEEEEAALPVEGDAVDSSTVSEAVPVLSNTTVAGDMPGSAVASLSPAPAPVEAEVVQVQLKDDDGADEKATVQVKAAAAEEKVVPTPHADNAEGAVVAAALNIAEVVALPSAAAAAAVKPEIVAATPKAAAVEPEALGGKKKQGGFSCFGCFAA